jgi:hypothetical protein
MFHQTFLQAEASADRLKDKGYISKFSKGTSYQEKLLRICGLNVKLD